MGTHAISVPWGGPGRFGFLHLLALVLCMTLGSAPALAEETVPSCEPVIARIVSLQGTVEVRRRAGSGDWLPITRLDTPICSGDLLRTGATSRAALYVQSETVVRVDQHTTVALAQTAEETVVEFFEDQGTRSTSSSSCGAGYFISRFPKKLNVKTPYLNAAIEGTEFQMALQCATTEVAVVEGAVRARTVLSGQERVLTKGESWTVGPATPAVFKTVIKPTDAVQWVLYYLPLSETNSGEDTPTTAQCRSLQSPADQSCLTHRAEVLLRRGQTDDALRAIDETLALDRTNADANALRAVIEIAANNVAAAREAATAATLSGPDNYRAWLALSYAQQSTFDLNAALDTAQKAQSLQPTNALLNARVAELLLSLGRFSEAEKFANEAARANPSEPLGHTILGFVHLAQINTKAAREDFAAAINNDSFEPLPRLGLGLAIIREGRLAEGREQLEIAVALDPSNSLLRSYVGKAYYEENTKARDALATTQFGLAKQLDPNDPTPWFYDAILQLSQNRSVEALESLNTSVEKNDDRAVYRSKLEIDGDRAARVASVAAVYGNLGFERLAVLASTKAIDEDPSNSSAHELLATSYSNLPRYDIARVSEALQAQIRQPLSLSTVPLLLTTDNLTILRDAGPSRSGMNEYNLLFNRDGFRLEADGVSGSRDTLGDQVVLSALRGNVAGALSQLHYETDGFTRNDSSEKDIYDVFVQAQVTPSSSIQLDLKRTEFKVGETFFAFDPDPINQVPVTFRETGNAVRLSGNVQTERDSDWIWSASYDDRNRKVQSFPDGSAFADTNGNAYVGEVQQHAVFGNIQTIWGGGYVQDKEDFQLEQTIVRSSDANAYAYGRWRSLNESVTVQVGLAGDRYRQEHSPGSISVSRNDLSPKIGVTWSPRTGSTVRAAAFSSVKRPFVGSQTIEPTQIAGFNQYFSGFEQLYGELEGTVSKRAGIGFDQTVSQSVFTGIEVARRELDVPSAGLNRDVEWRESTGSAYLYKTFSFARWRSAATLAAQYEKIERPQIFTGSESIMDLKTIRVPIGIGIFDDHGLSLRISTSYVKQSGTFSADVGSPKFDNDNSAFITDASLDYRLPRRMGVLSVGTRNITDNHIDLVEEDPLSPQDATKRLSFVKLRIFL